MAIRKHRRVVAAKHVLQHGLGGGVEHELLGAPGLEDAVEGESCARLSGGAPPRADISGEGALVPPAGAERVCASNIRSYAQVRQRRSRCLPSRGTKPQVEALRPRVQALTDGVAVVVGARAGLIGGKLGFDLTPAMLLLAILRSEPRKH